MKNLINQRYRALSTNYVICIDITYIGIYGEVFLMIDLATRCVIGHVYSQKPIDTADVIEVIDLAIRNRIYLPSIEILHSDRGSVFKNECFYKFATSRNITLSRSSTKGHQNQVIERFNRTFKQFLTEKLQKLKKEPIIDIWGKQDVSTNLMGSLIVEVISEYNERPHSHFNKKVSPNQMEGLLLAAHGKQHPKSKKYLERSTDSEIDSYKNDVITRYHGDWERFFLDWREEQRQFQIEQRFMQKTLSSQLHETTQELRAIRRDYESLRLLHMDQAAKLDALYCENERILNERKAKEDQKELRRSRQKKPIRETVNYEELQLVLSLIKGKSAFILSRRRLCIILLYLTGLRVSNLLDLTIRQVSELLNKSGTTIRLIKNGAERHPLVLTKRGKKVLNDFFDDFLILSMGEPGSSNIIRGHKQETFSRENLNKEMNDILKKASVLLSKHLRSHSFRATYITELLKNNELHIVSDCVGHKSIGSTLLYNRSRLTLNERRISHESRIYETSYESNGFESSFKIE